VNTLKEYLAKIDDLEKQKRLENIINWIGSQFPGLKAEIKWNQPMFTDHGTFIIAFSAAKKHLAVAPEAVVIKKFADQIAEAGYSATKEIFRIPWNEQVNYELLEAMIRFNIEDKAGCQTFWRN